MAESFHHDEFKTDIDNGVKWLIEKFKKTTGSVTKSCGRA